MSRDIKDLARIIETAMRIQDGEDPHPGRDRSITIAGNVFHVADRSDGTNAGVRGNGGRPPCPCCYATKPERVPRRWGMLGGLGRIFFALLLPPPVNIIASAYCIYAWTQVSYVWWCRRCNWEGTSLDGTGIRIGRWLLTMFAVLMVLAAIKKGG